MWGYMSYWRCPNCQEVLYWRKSDVEKAARRGTGQCPFCAVKLKVRTQVVALVGAWIGFLGFIVTFFYSHDLLPNLAAQLFGIAVDYRVVLVIALLLEAPYFVLGPRYEKCQEQ
jgi:hypothetical protein